MKENRPVRLQRFEMNFAGFEIQSLELIGYDPKTADPLRPRIRKAGTRAGQGQEILEVQVRSIDADGGAVAGAHLKMGRTSDEVIELGERREEEREDDMRKRRSPRG
jgi:hypothetical protein